MTSTQATPLRNDAAGRPRVGKAIREYLGFYDATQGGDTKARKAHYAQMVNDFYDVVTDFYEYGWGDSFHFAPRYKGEAFRASLARHQHYLALKLGLRPGMTILDVGCGVGGPMRGVARFSGARVEGINYSAYQVEKGNRYNAEQGLADQCYLHRGDFMDMPFKDGTYDGAFAVEATCHAPDKLGCYGEVFRVLKPGASFAGYEWCLTDRFDVDNPRHVDIKEGIETGNSLPELAYTHEVTEGLEAAGFEVIEAFDRAPAADPETPWHLPLKGEGLSMAGFRMSPVGRWFTHNFVKALETIKVAPKGSTDVSGMLQGAATHLVAGGEAEIFTPCYFFLARKPE